MTNKELAKEILLLVGEEKNIANVTHCATRLRFNLKDDNKAQTDKIKATKGVLGVVNKGGQYQIVIGSEASGVYRELTMIANVANNAPSADAGKKRNPIVAALDTIAGCFTPILPAITAAGMLKAILALLVTFKLISNKSQNYQLINLFADAAFYFLPIMLASSSAVKFKANPFLAMTIGGILLHPTFGTMVAAAKKGEAALAFFGAPINPVSYASTVIPILLAVWFMSFVEPIADKISPKVVKFFTKPLITILVCAPVTLIVLGPLGHYCSNGIASGIKFLNSLAPWLVPVVMNLTLPLLVSTGMHYGLVPIGINNLATTGKDNVVGPGMIASNIAQGAASLAVALRTKNKELRQLATSAGITAVCGITEPALYGVSLRYKKPLIAAMTGGAAGGLFLGIMGVYRYGPGSPGLLTLPVYINAENPKNIIWASIGCAIAFAVSFLIVFFFGTGEDKVSAENAIGGSANAGSSGAGSKNQAAAIILTSPIEGKVVALKDVNDPTFAEEILGKGIAILPSGNKVVAPVDGTVEVVADTGHSVSLHADNGMDILIHIGLETVALKGKGFTVKTAVGKKVKKGDVLIEFDLNVIKAAGCDIVSPVIVSNSADYKVFDITKAGSVKTGDSLISVEA